MVGNSSAILALILLIVLVIVVVVALAYNPAPAVVVTPVDKTAKELLAAKTHKVENKSNMSPPNRTQLSPASEGSVVSNAWDALENIRKQRAQRNVY